MERLVTTENFKGATGIKSDRLAKMAMSSMKLNDLNDYYSEAKLKNLDILPFIENMLSDFNIKIDIDSEELKNIPEKGAFVTVSNHPFGGWDGIILLQLLLNKRKDFKVMSNFILSEIEVLKDCFIPVNPFENKKEVSSIAGLRKALQNLKEGTPLGIFPAGEVSSYQYKKKKICDKKWDTVTIRLIKKAGVPVIPVYFDGSNSGLFHSLGLLHPTLRTAQLVNELYRKKNSTIKVRIGKPISTREQNEFNNVNEYGRYLRARTYCLEHNLDPQRFFFPKQLKLNKARKVINEVLPELIKTEIEQIKEHAHLFSINNLEIYCAESHHIPHALEEIGRLREITFRKVGEGSNKSADIDQYDLYYKHLFIWDKNANKIVGSYRIGEGNKIFQEYGKQGFYIHSLFKIKKGFTPTLERSLELGRSFIRPEYQRNASCLFLLWKGILYYLLKNQEFRYLIGPVSISDQYSKLSKSLIIQFIKQNHFDQEKAEFIKPRKRFKYRSKNPEIALNHIQKGNIKQLESLIESIEPDHFKLPILIKKYIKQNARFIGFNIDPKFNNALDGFIILDLHQVDAGTINSLTKELNDDSISDELKNR